MLFRLLQDPGAAKCKCLLPGQGKERRALRRWACAEDCAVLVETLEMTGVTLVLDVKRLGALVSARCGGGEVVLLEVVRVMKSR